MYTLTKVFFKINKILELHYYKNNKVLLARQVSYQK